MIHVVVNNTFHVKVEVFRASAQFPTFPSIFQDVLDVGAPLVCLLEGAECAVETPTEPRRT